MPEKSYGTFRQQYYWDEANDTFLGVLTVSKEKVFYVPWILGLITYMGIFILFNTVLYTNPNAVFWVLAVIGVLCILGISMERSIFSSMGAKQKSIWIPPICYSCLLAAACGAALGFFCYDVYGYFSFVYNNARTYQNTIPSQPAASVADAGRMIFAAEAYIDQTKAAGYVADDRRTYCVAPIRDMVETTHVEFWAVGYDCCDWTGSFKCDDSGDPDARGGIVVFDSPGYFLNSNRDYYNLARKKAEAQYDLVSVDSAIYVRWVKNERLGMLQRFYQDRAAWFGIVTFSLYAILTFSIGWSKHSEYVKEWKNRPWG